MLPEVTLSGVAWIIMKIRKSFHGINPDMIAWYFTAEPKAATLIILRGGQNEEQNHKYFSLCSDAFVYVNGVFGHRTEGNCYNRSGKCHGE